MAGFAYNATERDDWSDEAAAAILLAALAVRARVNTTLAGSLPDTPGAVFESVWWDDAVATDVAPVFDTIARAAVDSSADGMGIELDDETKAGIAAFVATAAAALLLHRGEVVTERVVSVLDVALENGHDATWVATQLGVNDGDHPGPLSDAVAAAMGVSVGLAIADMAADAVASTAVTAGTHTGDKTWNAHMDERTRPTHWTANGQTVTVGEPFTVGGFPGMFPHDPALPIDETAGCRCWVTYTMSGVAAADEPDPADVVDLQSGPMTDVDLPIAASSDPAMSPPGPRGWTFTGVHRSFGNGTVRFFGTKAMGRRLGHTGAPVAAVTAAAGAPDFADGIAVTVEPTVPEKQMLAVDGGLPVSEIHCTLAYLGTTAELDAAARLTVSEVMANLAAETGPFDAEVAGVGWFGTEDAITLYLVDSLDLAAFRTELVMRLLAAGIPVASDHGFIPHITAAYTRVDEASSRAGMPLHFTELRCRWGTEVLVADLVGGEAPPAPGEPAEPEVPPAEVVEEVPIVPPVEETATMDTAAETVIVAPDDETPPADLAGLPDAALVDEIARRAADAAIEMARADGGELTNDDMAAIHAAAQEQAEGIFDEIVEECGDEDTVPIGGAEGFTTVISPDARFSMMLPSSLVASAGNSNTPVIMRGPDHKGQAFAIEGIRPAPEITEFDWEGPITVEGVPSGDQRMFAEGSLDWRQLPVPMAWLDKITSEHQEGELAGWIHQISRLDGGAIWAKGTYAPTDAAERMRSILDDPKGPGRFGISVDVDSVSAVYSTPDGTILDPMEAQEAYYAGEQIMQMMTAGRIAGATCVMHPAFMEAQVWNVGPSTGATVAEAVAASAGLPVSAVPSALVSGFSGAPTWRSVMPGSLIPYDQAVVASVGDVTTVDVTAPPPASWFELDNDLLATMVASKERGAFDVFAPDDKGRIRLFGIVAPPNECHIGIRDRCQLMPRSRDFSKFYATGEPGDPWAPFYTGAAFDRFYADGKAVICEGGERVVVGPLILDNVHPNLRLKASDRQPWYAHTGAAVGDVRMHMTPHGLVAAGAIRPGVSWIDVYKLRASSVSPDWPPINGELKMIALLAVNVSGFQLAIAASGGVSWEDAIMETQERVEALVASAGVAHGRRRMVERVADLEAEVAELRAGVAPIIERTAAQARTSATVSALAAMGVAPTVVRTTAALAAMGIGTPEPCGCDS